MRIISGLRRGMKLSSLDGLDTRPTTDRVKENVFNIISFALPCENVLDLFAGSGALGIEAISRGSSRCTFVESNKNAIKIIKQNIESASFSDKCDILMSDAVSFLKSCSDTFDLILLDPPYNKGFLKPVLDIIYERNLLSDDGIIVVETERDGESIDGVKYNIRKSVAYGKTAITILQR